MSERGYMDAFMPLPTKAKKGNLISLQGRCKQLQFLTSLMRLKTPRPPPNLASQVLCFDLPHKPNT